MNRLFYLIIGLLPAQGWAINLQAIWLNNQGVKSVKTAFVELQTKPDKDRQHSVMQPARREGFSNLVQALEKAPFDLRVQFNLAIALEVRGEKEKAARQYELIMARPDVPEKLAFAAAFNAGNLAAREGNVDGALHYYQKALDREPDSEEVKTNIELLWRASQSSGGGGGQGKPEEGDGEDKSPDPNAPIVGGKPVPQTPQELGPEDIEKIFEALGEQEQKVRAKELSGGNKGAPRGKDW